MTVLRLITDIEVSEPLSSEKIDAVCELVKSFAHGVVTTDKLSPDDSSYYGFGHIHISNEDTNCRTCARAAKDGRE